MANNDGYEYVDEASISRHLKCSVCGKPCVDPVSVRCKIKQVIFCRRCIELWIDRNHSCPMCHQNLAVQNLIPTTTGIVTDMLDDLPIRCLRCKKCPLRRGDFTEHKKKCCLPINRPCLSSDLLCTRIETHNQPDDELHNENRQLKSQVVHQQTQTITFQNEDPLLTTPVNQQERQIETLRNANRPIDSRINEQEIQFERPQTVLQQMMTRMNQFETQLITFQNENRQLTARVNERERRIETLENNNQELTTRMNWQERRMERLQIENENLTRQVNQQATQIETVQNENRQMLVRLNEHEGQFGQVKHVLERTIDRMNQCETTLATVQNENRQLTARMESLREENQQMRYQMATFREENQQMRSRINQLESQVRTLQNEIQRPTKKTEEQSEITKFPWHQSSDLNTFLRRFQNEWTVKDEKDPDDNQNRLVICPRLYPHIPLSLVIKVRKEENPPVLLSSYQQDFTYETPKKFQIECILDDNKQVDDNKDQLKSLPALYENFPASLVTPVPEEKVASEKLIVSNMPLTNQTLQNSPSLVSMNNNQNQQQTQAQSLHQNNPQRRSQTASSLSSRNRTTQGKFI